jgi:hypothetical protein
VFVLVLAQATMHSSVMKTYLTLTLTVSFYRFRCHYPLITYLILSKIIYDYFKQRWYFIRFQKLLDSEKITFFLSTLRQKQETQAVVLYRAQFCRWCLINQNRLLLRLFWRNWARYQCAVGLIKWVLNASRGPMTSQTKNLVKWVC